MTSVINEAMRFGEMLIALREHHGVTQVALAEKLGMTQPTLSAWEHGMIPRRTQTNLERFTKMANLFGIDVAAVYRARERSVQDRGRSEDGKPKIRMVTESTLSVFQVLVEHADVAPTIELLQLLVDNESLFVHMIDEQYAQKCHFVDTIGLLRAIGRVEGDLSLLRAAQYMTDGDFPSVE